MRSGAVKTINLEKLPNNFLTLQFAGFEFPYAYLVKNTKRNIFTESNAPWEHSGYAGRGRSAKQSLGSLRDKVPWYTSREPGAPNYYFEADCVASGSARRSRKQMSVPQTISLELSVRSGSFWLYQRRTFYLRLTYQGLILKRSPKCILVCTSSWTNVIPEFCNM